MFFGRLHGDSMNRDQLIGIMDSKGPPLSENDIRSFETEIGAWLPEDYRLFLAASNGGGPKKDYCFKGPTPDGEMVCVEVACFGGLSDEDALSLRSHRVCYHNRIPNELVWIGSDWFGNAICLGILDDARGKVYFWDHEAEMTHKDELIMIHKGRRIVGDWDGSVAEAGNVDLLADSFSDFIASYSAWDDGEFDVDGQEQDDESAKWWEGWWVWILFLPLLVLTLFMLSLALSAAVISGIGRVARKLAKMCFRRS